MNDTIENKEAPESSEKWYKKGPFQSMYALYCLLTAKDIENAIKETEKLQKQALKLLEQTQKFEKQTLEHEERPPKHSKESTHNPPNKAEVLKKHPERPTHNPQDDAILSGKLPWELRSNPEKYIKWLEKDGLPENKETKEFQRNISQTPEKQQLSIAKDFFDEITKSISKHGTNLWNIISSNSSNDAKAMLTETKTENKTVLYRHILYQEVRKDFTSQSISSKTVENIFKYAKAEISFNPNSALSQLFLKKSSDIMAQNHAKVQEYAGARYAAYIDNDYDKKTPEQQNKIKEIWKDRPFDIIALSVIAEKNLENQLTSRIKNADDLQAKLDNIPQVTELAQQLTVADIKESTEKAKTEARPNYELSQVPNDGKSSVKVATGRYA